MQATRLSAARPLDHQWWSLHHRKPVLGQVAAWNNPLSNWSHPSGPVVTPATTTGREWPLRTSSGVTRPKERIVDDTRPNLTGEDPAAAFAALFDSHASALRGYLAGRVGVDTADDLVAETFLIALRKRTDYDPATASVRGWLYGIATNLLRNHTRTELRKYRATERLSAEAVQSHDACVAAQVDAQRQLARALPRLSEQERDLLLLTSWAGLDPSEIATALNLSASTVRSRLHRVREKLQTMIGEQR